MSAHHRTYRGLVRLYPRSFRDQYGDALELHFADLLADRGARATWARTGLDLAVTLPRYRLESLMTERQSNTGLVAAISLLVAGGVASFLTGMYPGGLLFLAALGLAVAQRSRLARSIRTPDTDLRRRRLRTGGVLTVTFVVLYAVYTATIGDHWTVRETVLALTGTVAMVAGIVFLVAGLLTPRSAGDDTLVARG